MIRINLLPHKRDARAAAPTGQKWLLAIVALVVLEVVALFLFHQSKLEELARQNQNNAKVQADIDQIKKLVANHEEVKKALAVLRAREDAIAQLQAARTGPTAVLLELAQILTPGKGPSTNPDTLQQLRKDNPLNVFNASWDSRRLWLASYTEQQRVVKIDGMARDGSDVSELAQRLKLSPYFYEVTILPGKKETSSSKVELINFALQAKVRY